MDNVVGKILSKQGREDDLAALEQYLEKQVDVLAKAGTQQLTLAVDSLLADPKKHAMGIVWLAAFRAGERDEGTIPCVERLLLAGGLINLVGHKLTMRHWRTLVHRYSALLRDRGEHRRALHFLRLAMEVRTDPSFLTPASTDFLMLALSYHNTKLALPVLEQRILHVDPSATGVTVTDYLLYYYYAGLVYALQKRWADSMRHLQSALLVPGLVASSISCEAYKLYLLVGVISAGRTPPLPPNTSYSVERAVHQLGAEYADFAAACENGDQVKVQQVLDDHGRYFKSEMLRGMLVQAQLSTQQRRILELTRVYVTLSLKQMADSLGVSEASVQTMLLRMIEDGLLNASITPSGMVSFSDEAPDSIASAERRIDRLQELVQRIEALDDDVALSVPAVTERLRGLPNYRQLLVEYEQKRKNARGLTGAVQDFFRGN